MAKQKSSNSALSNPLRRQISEPINTVYGNNKKFAQLIIDSFNEFAGARNVATLNFVQFSDILEGRSSFIARDPAIFCTTMADALEKIQGTNPFLFPVDINQVDTAALKKSIAALRKFVQEYQQAKQNSPTPSTPNH